MHKLRDPATDNIVIYPGSKVHFSATAKNSGDSYFIAGEINASGQKAFTTGLTLFQAILASGGEKASAKRATIRRRNEGGTLTAHQHDLRAIRRGKSPDPTLLPGDMIEISK
jgi:polysaccharide export outer membrane protein